MARLKKPLPKFATEEEEAEFWDKHSPLEFFDISEFEPLQVKIPKNAPITIRLDSNTRGKLEKIASARKMGLSTFVRKLIIEHIEGRQRSERQNARKEGGK